MVIINDAQKERCYDQDNPLGRSQEKYLFHVKEIEDRYDRFTTTRNGIDKVIILSTEEFEGLMEMLDIPSICPITFRVSL